MAPNKRTSLIPHKQVFYKMISRQEIITSGGDISCFHLKTTVTTEADDSEFIV